MQNLDTYCALATPEGESALCIVRVSGPQCLRLCNDIFGIDSPAPRAATLRNYKSIDESVLDQCVFTYFEGGKSYTGEPMLEFSLHGNPMIAQKVLEDLVSRGCRLAEPGEFTRSAFLNGKMDLTQAEAVQDIIRARSDAALDAAQKQLNGDIGRHVQRLIDKLLKITAQIEVYIDFPEEDLPPEDAEGPLKGLSSLIEEYDRLISTQHYSSLLHEGIKVVIIGEPNVGKSSLLNALLGQSRAIVDAQPGTTRDYIEDRMIIGRHLFRVTDTAGLREAAESIEREGMHRTHDQLQQADIVLAVVDSTTQSPTLPSTVHELLNTKMLLVIENKSDLRESHEQRDFLPNSPHLSLSALTGEGLEDLKKEMLYIVESELRPIDSNAILINSRHASALQTAQENLRQARDKFKAGEFTELGATHLHDAIQAMGDIAGRIDNERMLDQLFAEFCIGK